MLSDAAVADLLDCLEHSARTQQLFEALNLQRACFSAFNPRLDILLCEYRGR